MNKNLRRNIRNMALAGAIWLAGLALSLVYKDWTSSIPVGVWYLLVLFMGLFFVLMGVYALFSGRVYGRTWEKYWGGWVSIDREGAYYYWSYTLMYLIAGVLLLFGCRMFV